MKEESQRSEKRILQSLISQSRGDILDCLEKFNFSCEISKDAAYDEASDEIFHIIMKIVRRAMRFVEYRSKIKILHRGDKITEKEIERCDVVIKFNHRNQIRVLKNKFLETDGLFDRAETIPE